MEIATTIATGALLATIFNFIKPYADAAIPQGALHDATMRIIVVVLGVVVGIVQYLLGVDHVTGHALATAALQGAADGVTAIAAYHLVQGDITTGTSSTAPLTALEPAALQPVTPPVQNVVVTHRVEQAPVPTAPVLSVAPTPLVEEQAIPTAAPTTPR